MHVGHARAVGRARTCTPGHAHRKFSLGHPHPGLTLPAFGDTSCRCAEDMRQYRGGSSLQRPASWAGSCQRCGATGLRTPKPPGPPLRHHDINTAARLCKGCAPARSALAYCGHQRCHHTSFGHCDKPLGTNCRASDANTSVLLSQRTPALMTPTPPPIKSTPP